MNFQEAAHHLRYSYALLSELKDVSLPHVPNAVYEEVAKKVLEDRPTFYLLTSDHTNFDPFSLPYPEMLVFAEDMVLQNKPYVFYPSKVLQSIDAVWDYLSHPEVFLLNTQRCEQLEFFVTTGEPHPSWLVSQGLCRNLGFPKIIKVLTLINMMENPFQSFTYPVAVDGQSPSYAYGYYPNKYVGAYGESRRKFAERLLELDAALRLLVPPEHQDLRLTTK